MKWKDSLTQWRKSRNSVPLVADFIPSIREELDEYSAALDASDEHEIVDALADIMVFTANEIALRGYDIDLVMKQVIKHISARQQSPSQAAEWNDYGPSGKWLKNPSQDPSTLYEPDYTVCRLAHS